MLLATPDYRVVAVDDTPLHPAFCRVILMRHVREMTDLDAPARAALMDAVFATERAMRAVFPSCKINLASLGNLTPHLHWHVIARFSEDPHFPAPIWANALHARAVALAPDWAEAVKHHLTQALGDTSTPVHAAQTAATDVLLSQPGT